MELDGSLFNDDLFSVDLENIAIPSLPLHFQFPDTDLADEADKSGRSFLKFSPLKLFQPLQTWEPWAWQLSIHILCGKATLKTA